MVLFSEPSLFNFYQEVRGSGGSPAKSVQEDLTHMYRNHLPVEPCLCADALGCCLKWSDGESTQSFQIQKGVQHRFPKRAWMCSFRLQRRYILNQLIAPVSDLHNAYETLRQHVWPEMACAACFSCCL